MDDDIKHQLDRIARNQELTAVMVAILGVCWGFSKAFPVIAKLFI